MLGVAMRSREAEQGCGVERSESRCHGEAMGEGTNEAERSILALPQPTSETPPACGTPPPTTAYSEIPLVIT